MSVDTLNNFVYEALVDTKLSHDTRAYVSNVISHLNVADVITGSIVLEFIEANNRRTFQSFQRVADWTLCAGIMFYDAIANDSEAVFHVGMLSYSKCNSFMMNAWPVFKTLSNELPNVVHEARLSLMNILII